MPTIQLTQVKSTVVSQLDFAYLMQWKWRFIKSHSNGGYAVRWAPGTKNPRELVFMHNVVAERMKIGKRPDHHNQNKLDNRRSNLRSATKGQQEANKGLQKNNESGFRGVSWRKDRQKWHAQIWIDRKRIHLGYWKTKKAAARAYNRAAIKAWPKHAHLNPVTPRF